MEARRNWKINKKIGYIHINGQNIISTIDLEECKEHELEIIGITETHLRNKSKWEGKYYRLEAKGREKRNKKGVALMINKQNDCEQSWAVNTLNVFKY